MQIRDAQAGDVPAMTELYNELVRTSTAVYNDQPVTLEERMAWWRRRVDEGFPVLVAVEDDATVAGYATFGYFRPWPGYRYTVEATLHLREGRRGQGMGTELLQALAGRAQAMGLRTLMACVDSGNEGALRFFGRHGFVERGRLPGVGYKFGAARTVVMLQRPVVLQEHPVVEAGR